MEEPNDYSEQQQVQGMRQAPSYEQVHPFFAQWSLDTKQKQIKIEHYLRGEVEKVSQDGKSSYWTKEYDEIINKQGIYELMRFIEGFVDKGTFLTNLGEEQARRIAKINSLEVNNFLYLNHARFELKLERYEFLVNEITNFVEFAVYRAYKDNTKKWINPQTRELVNTINQGNNQQQPKKFLGLFNL